MALKQSSLSSKKITIEQFYTEEIVIGLCAPIGVDLQKIEQAISDKLNQYAYTTKSIRISSLIKDIKGSNESANEIQSKRELIEKGNQIREENKNGAFLAEKAIEVIFKERTAYFPDGVYKSRRLCTIINSIKNTSELKLLKEIYGSSFYLIGIFSSEENRIKNLTKSETSLQREAEDLIAIDFNQKGGFGQEVGKIFHSADYFIRLENPSMVDAKVERLLKLIFDTDIATPTTHELAMFEATSASKNSACLSRQVGASIVDSNGLIISTGWNDVPKFGGGTYKTIPIGSTSGTDHRCYNDGAYCRNDKNKQILIKKLIKEFENEGIIEHTSVTVAIDILSKSAIGDLIEYSKAVHAEMHAIINAGRSKSGRLIDSVLYSTTYPCHSCARHIVAAGIKEVYFIEPYPKSKAMDLHDDSITHDENKHNCLKILAYEGVSPSRYLDFFDIKTQRKNSLGEYKPNEKKDASPKIEKIFESIYLLEAAIADKFRTSGDDGGEGAQDEKIDATKAA